ncbi:MAG: hypothetical protein B5M56_06575 [Desulfococcus sp. 4484_241]|nr:MAG: hypothetical protein B5M56_06575 [Desulfococcus sp. 4484_241]
MCQTFTGADSIIGRQASGFFIGAYDVDAIGLLLMLNFFGVALKREVVVTALKNKMLTRL